MTLRIHRADRSDLLADGLAELFSTPPEDPLAEEVVVVPARGVERWLTQRLSHRLGVVASREDGVCAGVRFFSPRSLVALLLNKEMDDPWDPDRMVWPLLRVIDESLDEPWSSTLASHLGHGLAGVEHDLRRGRRYSVARRLAGLFASYAIQRPQMVTAWRKGDDTDGTGQRLDSDLAWQPELWRRLVDRVDAPPPDLRHIETVARLKGDGAELALPSRLSLFGHTRLPRTEVELLAALADRRDVHLWLPQVSDPLWRALAETAEQGPIPRRNDASIQQVAHPLLGSLGRDAREFQRILPLASSASDEVIAAPRVVEDRCPGAETLLRWLQRDLRTNATASSAERQARIVEADDHSVQVNACHGAARQVEVLREVLVGLLQDDPTLEPRDIIVMCPDIETYAPLIQAAFGFADLPDGAYGHPGHRLRVRLADRALANTNPLLEVATRLIDLAGGRVTATQVLDLAATDPVHRRFGFDDDALTQLTLWVEEAAIRWGLDSTHRGRYGLRLPDNTWERGLDRILLGVAMAEHEDGHHQQVGDALPIDDVSSQDIDLAGRFAEYLDRLRRFIDATDAAAAIPDWTTALARAVDQLTDVHPRDAWQRAQFDREIARIRDAATTPQVADSGTDPAAEPVRVGLADVRHLLSQRLGARPTRANFRTGTLTVCTMVPMRSVPHRVVCLLGLDDGVFPRVGWVDGDDVLARNPMTGERDIRSEDRQLFLDAILAAQDTLVVTYSGANEHTGAERPPAVPLGELLDTLDRTASAADHRLVREHVVVHHPLQPFDARNYVDGALVPRQVFSFDAAALAGARAARGTRTPAHQLLAAPLPPREVEDVDLADLLAFFVHPVRGFLRARLDVITPLEAEEIDDSIPITLDGLDKWQIGDRMLAAILAGTGPDDAARAERLRGILPPGLIGDRFLTEVDAQLRPLVRGSLALRQGRSRSVDIDVDLGAAGRRLTGTVTPVWGNRLVTVTYARLAAKHRLASWINLLALSAGHPDQSWTARAVGRGSTAPAVGEAGPLDHRALTWLRALVEIYDRGQREPLPLPMKTACAYAEALRKGGDADWKARREWETQPFSPPGITGEDADPAHVQAFGANAPFACLTTTPRPDEDWNSEPHRLGRYAVRLWGPLLDGAEQVTHL